MLKDPIRPGAGDRWTRPILAGVLAGAALAFLLYGFTRPISLLTLFAGLTAIQLAQGSRGVWQGWAGVATSALALLAYQLLDPVASSFPTSVTTFRMLFGQVVAIAVLLVGNLLLAWGVNRASIWPRNAAMWLPASLAAILIGGLLLPYVLSLGWMSLQVARHAAPLTTVEPPGAPGSNGVGNPRTTTPGNPAGLRPTHGRDS